MAEVQFIEAESPQALRLAARIVNNGGTIVFPTDTVYGLLASAEYSESYAKIFKIKEREVSNPIGLLVHRNSALAGQVKVAMEGFPDITEPFNFGTLTVIVDPDELPGLPERTRQVQPGPIGIRQPVDRLSMELLELTGSVWATSANRAADPVCTSASELKHWIRTAAEIPDLVVTSRKQLSSIPSRVVRITGDSPEWIRK